MAFLRGLSAFRGSTFCNTLLYTFVVADPRPPRQRKAARPPGRGTASAISGKCQNHGNVGIAEDGTRPGGRTEPQPDTHRTRAAHRTQKAAPQHPGPERTQSRQRTAAHAPRTGAGQGRSSPPARNGGNHGGAAPRAEERNQTGAQQPPRRERVAITGSDRGSRDRGNQGQRNRVKATTPPTGGPRGAISKNGLGRHPRQRRQARPPAPQKRGRHPETSPHHSGLATGAPATGRPLRTGGRPNHRTPNQHEGRGARRGHDDRGKTKTRRSSEARPGARGHPPPQQIGAPDTAPRARAEGADSIAQPPLFLLRTYAMYAMYSVRWVR